MDANLNRAVEGVRVVEDLLRFGKDAAGAAEILRGVRHDLRTAANLIPGGNAALLAARDSEGDVARNAAPITGREKAESVAAANFKRAQEAARSLEEFSKLISPAASAAFGEVRFKLYDMEKKLFNTGGAFSSVRMPAAPFLYAVADYKTLAGVDGKFSHLKKLCAGGVGIVQLREKSATDRELVEALRKCRRAIGGSGALLAANDRADIAAASGADVLHLGQDDLDLKTARKITGGAALIGLSTHSFAQAMKALEEAPDYISVGPVFSSPTKPDKKPVGVKLLKRVVAAAGNTPVVAIGGASLENLEEALDAGASGVAMISALAKPKTLEKTLKKANEILERYK